VFQRSIDGNSGIGDLKIKQLDSTRQIGVFDRVLRLSCSAAKNSNSKISEANSSMTKIPSAN
jgi:hypothetical protein